jgi:hypothetical protein
VGQERKNSGWIYKNLDKYDFIEDSTRRVVLRATEIVKNKVEKQKKCK